MSEPRRVGLTELLRTSVGAQFVIPVYQRNYTWTPEREVKQYLNDLCRVLRGEYKNHFITQNTLDSYGQTNNSSWGNEGEDFTISDDW